MPKELFSVLVQDIEEVHTLPELWDAKRLQKVLALADYDDVVDESDLLDMVILVLQDLEEQVAGEIVLEAVFGDNMNRGVRENLVNDLKDDRPWEQFSRVDQQAGVFEAVVLLQMAFPHRYGVPDALKVRLNVRATDAHAGRALKQRPSPLLLLRLMAASMEDDTVLNRRYGQEMQMKGFPYADAIVWRVLTIEESRNEQGSACVCDVYSAHQWLSPLVENQEWLANASPD
ncbi:MAG: hypothetical protein ACFHXK_18420 [bacterium]